MKDDTDPLAQLFRVTCPSPLELQLYYFHELHGSRQGEVSSHLERCPHCTADFDSLVAFMTEESAEAVASLPERVRSAAEQLAVFIARLVPAAPAPAVAYRGESSLTQLYDADDLAIALHVERQAATGRYRLSGQVMSALPEEALTGSITVAPRSAAAKVTRTALRATGGFEVQDLDENTYHMVISLPTRRIVVPAIQVGSSPGASA